MEIVSLHNADKGGWWVALFPSFRIWQYESATACDKTLHWSGNEAR